MADKSILQDADNIDKVGVSDDNIQTPEGMESAENSTLQPDTQPIKFNFAWLKTETGEGDINDYINHPLNFNNSKGFAQVIRGATGFFGSLKLAIVDIILGILQITRETKKTGATAAPVNRAAAPEVYGVQNNGQGFI